MADLTHPAEEVPGGLWRGAVVFRTECEPRCVVTEWGEGCRSGFIHDGKRLHEEYAVDLLIRLDDPLGLGLAGLAARVAERLGCSSDVASVCHHINAQTWSQTYGNWTQAAVIMWAASCLALSDRLAALVGLTLAPGEVARWEFEEGMWSLSRAGELAEDERSFADPSTPMVIGPRDYEVPGLADITDPLTALRAAVRELEASNG